MVQVPHPADFLKFAVYCFALVFIAALPAHAQQPNFTVSAPSVVLSQVEFEIKIQPGILDYQRQDNSGISYWVQDQSSGKRLAQGTTTLNPQSPQSVSMTGITLPESGPRELLVSFGGREQTITLRAIPGFLSILPPLVAIIMALVTRQVIVALFFGVWMGASFVYSYNPFLGFLKTLDTYIVQALAKPDHVFILIFSLALGGMVGVISKAGGTQGIVEKLSTYAKTSRGGQFSTWLMGVVIFFDDYANTLIVGNTMRPLSDKLRISREKLSYLVDSTAAPVANIAIISTWIGYEISLISQSFQDLGEESNAYITFLKMIPYNFYPIFTLVFGFLIAVLVRDFGPMWRAERRARKEGKVLGDNAMPLASLAGEDILADEQTPKRWYNALIPVLVVIGVVCVGLFYNGWEASNGWESLSRALAAEGKSLSDASLIRKISAIIGEANSFEVLMWASFLGSIVAIFLALGQRLLTLHQALEAWVNGIRSMIMAAIILTAAWAIGSICSDLFTAQYVLFLTEQFLSPQWLPVLVFLSASVIAFSTGTSWGTMAILMPIAIPLAHQLPLGVEGISAAHAHAILLSTTAAVLAGATFGDHCSPISDTTIMSSMASGADHIDHVRTQLPYALTAGGISCLFGYIPIGFGISNWVVLPLGIISIFMVIRFVGKKTDG